MSGHSKWATIKHKKGAADKKRGKLFAKLIKQVEVAARQGGGDLDANPTLRTMYQKARDNSVPLDTIERAINLFQQTPLNRIDFKATMVKVATTDFETNDKSNLYYALAIVLGGIIGVVYVLIANAFRNRKITQ